MTTGDFGKSTFAKISLLGDPSPASATTPWVAPVAIAELTADGVSTGFASSISAATPATCGAAIEVPLFCPYLPDGTLLRIPTPGAKTSKHWPKFEKDARASV